MDDDSDDLNRTYDLEEVCVSLRLLNSLSGLICSILTTTFSLM